MLSEQQQMHTKAKPAERPWVWDSHSNTVDSEAAARAARANVSVEDQIAQIHRRGGNLDESVNYLFIGVALRLIE